MQQGLCYQLLAICQSGGLYVLSVAKCGGSTNDTASLSAYEAVVSFTFLVLQPRASNMRCSACCLLALVQCNVHRAVAFVPASARHAAQVSRSSASDSKRALSQRSRCRAYVLIYIVSTVLPTYCLAAPCRYLQVGCAGGLVVHQRRAQQQLSMSTKANEPAATGHQPPGGAPKRTPEQEAMAQRIGEHQKGAARLSKTEEVRAFSCTGRSHEGPH